MLLRSLLLILAFTLGSAGMLPVWAQLAGVEGPHVCHCSTDHHDCVCSRCDTDPDAAKYLSTESLTGRCGDDDIAFGGKGLIAILAPEVSFPSALVERGPTLPVHRPMATQLSVPPPTPPPRTAG